MSAWYLLWMFFDVVGLFVLCVATPFLLDFALDSHVRALDRQFYWRTERRRRREIELYGQLLGPCLYCGSQCEFGPGCANREFSPARRASRRNEQLLREMPHLRERAPVLPPPKGRA
jgi:hypothetical protein